VRLCEMQRTMTCSALRQSAFVGSQLQQNESGFEFGGGWWRLDQLRARRLGLFRLDEAFNFGAEAHAAIAKGIGLGMHNAGFAVRIFRLATGDFDGHTKRCLNRHTDLKWRRSYEEKSAARKIYGFGEMLRFVGSQTDGAKAQRHSETKAFKMSAFRRHETPRGTREGDAAATSWLRKSRVTEGETGSKSCCLRGKKNFGSGSTS
jgi:hypothetical protein